MSKFRKMYMRIPTSDDLALMKSVLKLERHQDLNRCFVWSETPEGNDFWTLQWANGFDDEGKAALSRHIEDLSAMLNTTPETVGAA